jgi:hypothetical protein
VVQADVEQTLQFYVQAEQLSPFLTYLAAQVVQAVAEAVQASQLVGHDSQVLVAETL